MTSTKVNYAVNTGNVDVSGCVNNGNTVKLDGNDKDSENAADGADKLELPERTKFYWWNPQMDSKELQGEFCFLNATLMRNIANKLIAFWTIHFSIFAVYFFALAASYDAGDTKEWLPGAIWCLALALLYIALLLLPPFTRLGVMTRTTLLLLSLHVTSLVTCFYVTTPTWMLSTAAPLSVLGCYQLMAEVVVTTHVCMTSYPLLRHYGLFGGELATLVAILHSVIFEVFVSLSLGATWSSVSQVIFRMFFHLILHFVAITYRVRLAALQCDIFWKIFQIVRSSIAKDQTTADKDQMIKDVMPPSTAAKIFHTDENKKVANDFTTEDGGKLFRNFIMQQMDEVSILYADIVGFTQMSSNKTAAELVGLLNDLFGRFDRLCEVTGCEKISTLGDCYYCVAGCPQPREDHAICCVEMGLGMIAAIKQFCVDNNTNVNMRVGVHTGRVMCGIIGTKRFKFDVFSNDVSLANGMEQWGLPGRIHITEATLKHLQDKFVVEDSALHERSEPFLEKVGGKTYFIVRHKDGGQMNDGEKTLNGSSKKAVVVADDDDDDDDDGVDDHQTTLKPLLAAVECGNNVQATAEVIADLKADQQQGKIEEAGKTGNKQSANALKQEQMEYLAHRPPAHTVIATSTSANGSHNPRKGNSVRDITGKSLFRESYRMSESLHPVTMRFRDESLESSYGSSCNEDQQANGVKWSHGRRALFIKDCVCCFAVNLLVFVLSILQLDPTTKTAATGAGGGNSDALWISLFVVFALSMAALSVVLWMMRRKTSFLWNSVCRQMVGVYLCATPVVFTLAFINCAQQLASCKSFLLIFIVILFSTLLQSQVHTLTKSLLNLAVISVVLPIYYAMFTCTSTGKSTLICFDEESWNDTSKRFEFIVDFVVIFIFLLVLYRITEFTERLLFENEQEIKRNMDHIQKEKRRVEALMENFIPPHVRREMGGDNVYSKTHKNVGVIFGTIVNFNELYDEDYEGGMEYIRILSELISDFDDLLNLDKYCYIDKIKTIGTTMMLASGLNLADDCSEKQSFQHLKQLMEYCIEMQNVLDSFNKDLLNFQLVLRIGFNHGEVTAGVIGSTKRLYDIWGDTVNTASRMDSTGVKNRIQVSEESKKALENDYNFKHIGEKIVKGKGKMETYLVVRDDEDQRVIIPNQLCANYEPF